MKILRKGKHQENKREEKSRKRAAKKAAIKSSNSVHAVWGWQG